MDWRKNRVTIGAAVFVALLGLTLWASTRERRRPTSASEVPSVSIDPETVSRIEITRPTGERVVLANTSGQWALVEPLEAEADPSNAEAAINRLAELELLRIVATEPDNYARLEVDDAQAVRVTAKADDETLAELLIGKYANGMTMVRLAEHVEVFGASGSLRYAFDRDIKAWRNRRVVSIESSDVQSIRFESGNGTFQFDRTGETWSATVGKKKLDELDAKKVTSLVSTAARLTASGFADPDVSVARAGFNEPSGIVTMVLADGDEPIVIELGSVAEQETEVYLRRTDAPTIYLVSQYLAKRLSPEASAFEKSDEPPPPTPAMPAMPGAPPGAQPQGQPQLPPEVMRQIQEQIRQQQQQR